MKKVAFLKNYQLIFALLLILFIPAVLLLHNYYFVKTVKSNMDTEFINKGALAVNIVKNNFVHQWPNYSSIQSRIDEIVKETPEIKSLDVLVPEKENFKIVASINKKNVGKILDQTLNTIAWKEEFITFTTNSSSDSSDQSLQAGDYQSDYRYQMVVKVLKDTNGRKLGLISMKISLAEVDNLTQSLINRSFWTLIGIIVIVLLMIASNFRLFHYVMLFQKLKEVDQMKDEFISIASHELRAPLTAIRGYVSMLEEDETLQSNERLLKYVVPIKLSADRLHDLVEDMLDTSRIEQGRIKIDSKETDVIPVINEIISQFTIPAKEKGLEISLEEPSEEVKSARVMVDVDKVKQIVINLISNGIKYTPQGYVKVVIEIKEKNLAIKVKDSGMGMNAKAREGLFQKFYRVQNDETKKIVGTGLGLWITKQLIKAMKGDIYVDSIEGEGSVFTITFPLIK